MKTKRNPYRAVSDGELADLYGQLKAAKAELANDENNLKAELTARGLETVEGDLFRVTVSTSVRQLVDWKSIAAKFNPSRQLIRANTKESESVTFRVSARKQEQAA